MASPDTPQENVPRSVPRTEYTASYVPTTGFLAPSTLVERCVYRLRSRNLEFGVFNGANGFIGIRDKFNCRYLDTEYLADPPDFIGTARAIEQVGTLSNTIALSESLGSQCSKCNLPVDYVAWAPGEVTNGYPRRWVHIASDGTVMYPTVVHELSPSSVANDALFAALEIIEAAK
jgi:hypothetical protein